MANVQKEVWLGNKAKSLIDEALKAIAGEKKLSEDDGTAGLYEKFISPDGEEED